MDKATKALLRKTHGRGKCHICGKPKAGEGEDICSYPHMRIPVAPVDADHPDGFWTWDLVKEDIANG